MSDVQEQLSFEDNKASNPISSEVLIWICRSYESATYWKDIAADVFFAVNGESDVARNRVASIARAYFVETSLETEKSERWRSDMSGVESVQISPPRVSASNAAYVDWLYVADYLLLACASVSERYDEENQRRESESRQVGESFKIRTMVYQSRELIRQDSASSDSDLIEKLKADYPKIAMAHIKEARRLERLGSKHVPPKQPLQSSPLPRFTSLYFRAP